MCTHWGICRMNIHKILEHAYIPLCQSGHNVTYTKIIIGELSHQARSYLNDWRKPPLAMSGHTLK